MPLPISLHDTTTPPGDNAFCRMAFGTRIDHGINHPGLRPLSHDAAIETWGRQAPVQQGQDGPLQWSSNEQCLLGHMATAIGDDVEATTLQLYRTLLAFVAHSEFPHLLRIWNYLPRINAGGGDRELYRRFCTGRAQAFDERPCPADQLPAGTAIGTRDDDTLLVYFIATREPGQQIENPRQTSAFNYPRVYSPRKPLFSRATVWHSNDGAQLIVSGTASIVGHASRHTGDLNAQLHELWHNLESLRTAAQATRPIALRVYVRHAEDYPAVQAFLAQRLPADTATLYLLADICREELLVEIEGVYAMPDAHA